jgi:hypothetical protein
MQSTKEFEISQELKQRGIRSITREGNTICINMIDNCIRFGVYAQDFDKTVRSFDKNTKKLGIARDEALVQYFLGFLSKNWNELIDNEQAEIASQDGINTGTKTSTNDILTINKDLSFEDWQIGLTDRYFILRNTADRNFPALWCSLDFELSVNKILNIKDCTLPFAGILLGVPSSQKTLGIDLFRKDKNSFYTDTFTAKSFVSNSTAMKKEELADIDLLPKIRNKFFLTPELASMFSKKYEDVIETIGIITRILDGQGFECDTGAHGHRGYTGEYMFTWIGAAVDIPYKVHKILGTQGAKLYFLRPPELGKTNKDYLDQIKTDDFKKRKDSTEKALLEYLAWFDKCPIAIRENNLAKIPWECNKDDEDALMVIVRVGKLLAHLRGVVITWESDRDYSNSMGTIESPDRAMRQLTNLAKGHALSQGRNYITFEDIPLVIEVATSTASKERVKIFELLLDYGGTLTTSIITTNLNVSHDTANRTMAEFRALKIVEMSEPEYITKEKEVHLLPEFEWFLSPDFQNIRRANFQTRLFERFIDFPSLRIISTPSHTNFSNSTVTAHDLCYMI